MINLDELKMWMKDTSQTRIEIQRQTFYGTPEPKESPQDKTCYNPEVKD